VRTAGNGKDAKAWMDAHAHELPPEEPPPETGRRQKELGGDRNRVGRDAKRLAFAAEMADAARDIASHPALTEAERAIWTMHVKDFTFEAIAKVNSCSKSTVQQVVERVKALMVDPDELARAAVAAAAQARNSVANSPGPDEADQVFQNLERSIALGAHNAHRVIVNIHGKSAISGDDVGDNERAVRTLLNVRKSELDYLRLGVRGAPASDDEIRKIAGSEKV
jgi:hypothetical protein